MPRTWRVSDSDLREGNRGSLTESQVEEYDRTGYLILPNLITDEEAAGVRSAMTQKVERIAADLVADGLIEHGYEDEPFDSRLAKMFEALDDQDFLVYGRSWRDRYPGYYDLMTNPRILDVVESIIGREIFANPVYNVRPKVPRVAAGAVPWHQDKSYWPDAKSNPVVTVWIAIVDATEENGCLRLLPRTHRAPIVSHHAEGYSRTQYMELNLDEMTRGGSRPVAMPVPARTGIVFNDHFIHSSTPNRSSTVRWSVDLRYQPADQDPMPQHGVGFLARSAERPDAVASLEDWLMGRPEHQTSGR